ncbi:hypothetical protein H0H81_009252 [Sphagnurus paluster]|uniref:Peptidase S8/S53 domain-containing protein n=1 Tax=Sphagnurus paluster TaxID=117069 RepID=A0A9P7FVJ3_9AGAR|nr:hypothetical protein H0H81_009252 [Sphagnurus paluster]
MISIDGLNWVASTVRASGRPSIASLSLGGNVSQALDDAATSLVNMGIHVTAAAGNDNIDAQNTSPARAQGVVTVGSSNINDARSSFSNYGAVVDFFAPGENIISAGKDSNTATATYSGTSMGTPHVAGIIAYLIGENGNTSPQAMVNQLKTLSVKGKLSGVPAGTANNLVQNGNGAPAK